jgi:hypothetical protein
MLTLTFFNGPGGTPEHSEGDWEASLVGDEGEWAVTVQGPKKSDKWECGWDHTTGEITVVGFNADGDGLSNRLTHASQEFLRSHIRKIYSQTQGTLDFTGAEGCCQCGATETVNTELVVEVEGIKQFSLPEKVTWRCTTCWGLTCRNCCLTIPGLSPKKYYDDTYCSELCLACTTPMREWEAKQEVNGPFAKTSKA